MLEELNNLQRKQTWVLIPKPPNVKPVGSKWFFKRKRSIEGEIIKFKARLMAKDCSQVPGVHFTEAFSHAIKSIKILLALAVELDIASFKWTSQQLI